MTSAAERHRAHTGHQSLWDNLRLVAVDVETCQPPKQRPRIVSAALLTYAHERQTGHWANFVNPEVPIDADSQQFHRITDDQVAREHTLDAYTDQIIDLLTPRHDDERILLAGHNIRFDVSVLHAELERVGAELPELATFDTASTTLLGLLDVRPPKHQLPDVAAELGVELRQHHEATADARACAEITIKLLRRAAAAGYHDLDLLLADGSVGQLTTDIRKASKRTKSRRHRKLPERRISAAHQATHSEVLAEDPTDKALADWTDLVVECGTQRCPRLADRVTSTNADGTVVYAAVLEALDRLLDADVPDGPAVATVLGGIFPLLVHMPPKHKGNQGVRDAAFDWAHERGPAFDDLSRCSDDRCPDCQAGRPCPLDVWRMRLAPQVVGDTRDRAKGVLWPHSSRKGTGTYTTWLKKGWDRALADEALAEAVRRWVDEDNPDWALTVANDGFDLGCRHPDVVRLVADSQAAPGTTENLQAAVDVMDLVLVEGDSSTHPGWLQLVQHRRLLAGQLRRSRGIDTGKVDEDGNPVFAPRHHPTNPRRDPHPSRFAV